MDFFDFYEKNIRENMLQIVEETKDDELFKVEPVGDPVETPKDDVPKNIDEDALMDKLMAKLLDKINNKEGKEDDNGN